MQPFLDSTAFRVYAAVSAVLILKMLVLAGSTGATRIASGRYLNPEDARVLRGEQGDETDRVHRIQRAHHNAIENELPFVVLGLLYTLLGADPWGMQVYAYTFLTARVVHSGTYVFAVQPFRTLSWAVGALCLAGMCVQILMRAFA